MSDPFIGEIQMFPYTFPPRGWAYCNGQLLSIQQNTLLFAIIGTHFGGNGTSSFALPNLQGRVPLSTGQTPGLPFPWQVGDRTGTAEATLLPAQIPSHSHGAQILAYPGTAQSPSGQLPASSSSLDLLYKRDATALTPMADEAIMYTGDSQAHENMQPFLTLSFCIAIDGTFPSRN